MKLQFDSSKLSIKALVELRKIEYSRFQPTECPLLGDELVYFNNEGFFHLTHTGRRKFRDESDQRMRLNLLPNVPQVIRKAPCFGSPIRIVDASDNKLGKKITYYELTCRITPTKKISVVLRRIGDRGKLQYYSVRYNKRGDRQK